VSFNLAQDIRFVVHDMVSQEFLAYLFTNLMNNEQLKGRSVERIYLPTDFDIWPRNLKRVGTDDRQTYTNAFIKRYRNKGMQTHYQ